MLIITLPVNISKAHFCCSIMCLYAHLYWNIHCKQLLNPNFLFAFGLAVSCQWMSDCKNGNTTFLQLCWICKNCLGNSSSLNEDFLRRRVGKPKSTGSNIKYQPFRMPNPWKSQGPCSPISDGHDPRNLSCHGAFPLPGMPVPSLPPTLMSLAALFLRDAAQMSLVPWNSCLSLHCQGASHTHLRSSSHRWLFIVYLPLPVSSHNLAQH